MVAREIEKAQSTYNQACLMRENGYWDAAVNRLYYAVFHATREKSDYNCSFDATQGLINPLFEPTHQLIDTIAKMVTQQK